MEEQPGFEPSRADAQAVGRRQVPFFMNRLGRVLMFSFVGAAFYALVAGPRNSRGLADGLFIVGAILLLISLSPLIGEILGRATLSFRLQDRSLEDALEEERGRLQKSEDNTFLFGIGGIIVVALSFVFSFI